MPRFRFFETKGFFLFRFLIGSLVKAKVVHVILNFEFLLDLLEELLIWERSIPVSALFFQKKYTFYDIRKQKTPLT